MTVKRVYWGIVWGLLVALLLLEVLIYGWALTGNEPPILLAVLAAATAAAWLTFVLAIAALMKWWK